MKSLYHPEYYSYTPDAEKFLKEIESVVRPILERYFKMGFSPRELGAIANDTILTNVAEMTLVHASKIHKERQKKAVIYI